MSNSGRLPNDIPVPRVSPSESATRILANDGTWTKDDARICAKFVLAAQAEFKNGVAMAREAMEAGPEAVAEYLRSGE